MSAIGEQRAEQVVRRNRAKQQQQHRLEYAHAAGHVADDPGGDRDEEQTREGSEADLRLRRQEHVQHPGGTQQIGARHSDLREGDASRSAPGITILRHRSGSCRLQASSR